MQEQAVFVEQHDWRTLEHGGSGGRVGKGMVGAMVKKKIENK